MRALSERAVSRGGTVLAISLDIVNAFNSIPWRIIRESLLFHRVPPYLQHILSSYLSDRCIKYPVRGGNNNHRPVNCGVPQGSVLGPLLWNLAYDVVLRTILPRGVHVVCYADDTLVIAESDTYEGAIILAQQGVERVVGKIRELGLQVAPHKTEAMWFHKLPRGREPPQSTIRVGGVQVQVGQFMKYLGLTLDSRWGFEEHFDRLVPRIQRVAGAMHRLLPNLGGPNEGVRRLYAGVVRSIALYGAPVWSHRLSGVRRSRVKLHAVHRRMSIRIARGYRTISFEAASLLARFPPFDILADMDARVHRRVRDCDTISAAEIRLQEHQNVLKKWRAQLQEPQNMRQRVVEAIVPSFKAWLSRKWHVTYRLTQVLTGHGCFGEYLNRIGREATAQCHHCAGNRDTAQHTLEECSAWDSERQTLIGHIGQDLSLPAVVDAMLKCETKWKAVVSYCEAVMVQKESAERDRERADPARRRRRRGGGD